MARRNPRTTRATTADTTEVPEIDEVETVVDDNEEDTVTDDTQVPPADDAPPVAPPKDDTPTTATESKRSTPAVLSEKDLANNPYRKHWQEILDRSGVVPPEGRILFPGEPFTFTGKVPKGQDFIILEEPVYRMVVPFRSRRPTFTLEATAGTRVSRVAVVTKAQYEARTTQLLAEGI